MTTTINTRALLVNLSVSTWTARKFDRAISDEIAAQHGAAGDAGRYNKALIQGDSYKALIKCSQAARTEHYFQTLAWSDEGWRLLPTANHSNYADKMRHHKDRFEAALLAFVADYPDLKDIARQRLNGMFKDSDYPAAEQIADRFRMSIEYTPVPTAGDFRLDELTADQLQQVEQSVSSRVEQATADAVSDAWRRLHDVVGAMRERLAQPEAIFRDSLVENAKDVVDVLGRLNVTGDKNLAAMCDKVRTDLTAYSPQRLRTAPAARQETADKASAILSEMQAVS